MNKGDHNCSRWILQRADRQTQTIQRTWYQCTFDDHTRVQVHLPSKDKMYELSCMLLFSRHTNRCIVADFHPLIVFHKVPIKVGFQVGCHDDR